MATTILVTGAPGNVGSSLVDALREHPQVRIAAHDVDFARETFPDAKEIVAFDFLKSATFPTAFRAVDAMFLLRPPKLNNPRDEIIPALEAAKRAGVRHVVFLSVQGVDQKPWLPHYQIEKAIESMGFVYTFLRSGAFMQNLSTVWATGIKERDEIVLPMGHARTSFVDARDVASVAAAALLTFDGENHRYTLTGSETLDYPEVAAHLTKVLKRRIDHVDPSSFEYLRYLLMQDYSFGKAVTTMFRYMVASRRGAPEISADVLKVLGRAPIRFEEFAEDYKEFWAKSPI